MGSDGHGHLPAALRPGRDCTGRGPSYDERTYDDPAGHAVQTRTT